MDSRTNIGKHNRGACWQFHYKRKKKITNKKNLSPGGEPALKLNPSKDKKKLSLTLHSSYAINYYYYSGDP